MDINEHSDLLLHYAVQEPSINLYYVRTLVARGFNINYLDSRGNSPLSHALKNKNCDINLIQLLLELGAQVNSRNQFGYTPLHVALEYNSNKTNIIQLLISSGSNVNTRDNEGKSPMFCALRKPNCKDLLQMLLNEFANVNVIDLYGDSPLHFLIKYWQYNVDEINLLLEQGGEVMSKDTLFPCTEGATEHTLRNVIDLATWWGDKVYILDRHKLPVLIPPLRESNCNVEILKLLVNSGANVNALDGFNDIPVLMQALRNRDSNLEVTTILLSAGVNVNLVDVAGKSALHIELSYKDYNIRVVELLLESGLDVNVKGGTANLTPLMCAVKNCNCSADLIKLLLSKGANAELISLTGNSVLHYALQNSRIGSNIIKILLDKGAKLNIQNDHKLLPLHMAIHRFVQFDIVELLLKRGADAEKLLTVNKQIAYRKNFNWSSTSSTKNSVELLTKFALLKNPKMKISITDWGLKFLTDFLLFAQVCEKEVIQMESKKINCSVTLREFVSNQHEVGFGSEQAYIMQQNLAYNINQILDVLVGNKYPLFANIISLALHEKLLLNKLERMMYEETSDTCGKGILKILYIGKVGEYLPQCDLLNLILAFYKSGSCDVKNPVLTSNSYVFEDEPERRSKRLKRYVPSLGK